MGVKLNANTGGGSVELDVPNSVSSDITFTLPGTLGSNTNILSTDASGVLSFVSKGVKIVNVYNAATFRRTSNPTATATTTTAAALYSQPAGRVYVNTESLTLTPEASTNKLLFLCSVGFDSLTATSNKGAHGATLVKGDGSSWDFGNYPHYDAVDTYSNYPPPVGFSVLIDAGDTNSQTFELKAWAYNEPTGDDNHTIRIRDSSIIILELEP